MTRIFLSAIFALAASLYAMTAQAFNLGANGQLAAGQSVASNDLKTRLVMQGDGNLVLYDWLTMTPLWNSGTQGNPGARAVMQGDGNFVVYSSNNVPLWYTATAGNPGAYLSVQNDDNLVVYSASGSVRWARPNYTGPVLSQECQQYRSC